MVFKLFYSNSPLINSTINSTNHEEPISSLLTFPNELLLLLFESLDIPSILSLSNVCNRFLLIAQICLAKRFKDSNFELSLFFDQEYRQKCCVNFIFERFDSETGRFIFIPKNHKFMRFINSRMVGSPKLRKIQFTGFDNNAKVDNKNLLQKKPCAFPIELNNSTIKKNSFVYRIGRGSTHLKSRYTFTYSVSDSPPPLMRRTRGGERWIKPLQFECSPCFFYPHEPIAHQIIWDIIHFKKNQIKKHPIKLRNLSEISLSSINTENTNTE
ncbi:hypothetical protein F8M41_018003 [Gigaspora margarita]|uniref:F-box domain-containing protein n=1 Tax=Gigaspora margarita TaxID=4874 RepID=A0A8H4ELM5_GIGMA|nr:hypothetical protein F8M41_018003 [Gigaspora margarita]